MPLSDLPKEIAEVLEAIVDVLGAKKTEDELLTLYGQLPHKVASKTAAVPESIIEIVQLMLTNTTLNEKEIENKLLDLHRDQDVKSSSEQDKIARIVARVTKP